MEFTPSDEDCAVLQVGRASDRRPDGRGLPWQAIWPGGTRAHYEGFRSVEEALARAEEMRRAPGASWLGLWVRTWDAGTTVRSGPVPTFFVLRAVEELGREPREEPTEIPRPARVSAGRAS